MNQVPFEIEMTVRWGDMDAMGHVNNTLFPRYLEEGRVSFMNHLNMFGDAQPFGNSGPILAAITCNFRQQLVWPAQIRVQVAVAKLGTKSMTLNNRLLNKADGSVVTDGTATLVWFDFETQQTEALPDAVREALLPHQIPFED